MELCPPTAFGELAKAYDVAPAGMHPNSGAWTRTTRERNLRRAAVPEWPHESINRLFDRFGSLHPVARFPSAPPLADPGPRSLTAAVSAHTALRERTRPAPNGGG